MRANKSKPLSYVVKRTLLELYCRGVIPKHVTQEIFNKLKLKTQ